MHARILDGHIYGFSLSLIETAPDEHVEIEIAFAEDGATFQLSVVAHAEMCFDAIDVGPLLGNDVDHGSEGNAAIERRSRTTEYLYLTNLVE